MRSKILLYINGEKHLVEGEYAFWPLSRYVREHVGLTGTKVVCAEGDCGACTVLVTTRDLDHFQSINSCISPVFSNDGKHIVTVEGLDALQEGPHAVQQAMIKGNGAQCGFCSPGFVMSLTDLYEQHKNVDEKMVRQYTTGNLCRCTGYRDIIKSALNVNLQEYRSVKEFYLTESNKQELKTITQEALCIETNNSLVAIPTTLVEFFSFQKEYPHARLLSAATDIGVLMNKGKWEQNQFIFLGRIQEFNVLSTDGDEIYIGANKTLQEVEHGMGACYPQFSHFLEEFASPQIKNRGTLVGNIANGSPIGDSLPFLSVVGTVICIASSSGEREVAITKFYKGYKQLDLEPGEIIVGVKIPKLKAGIHLNLYKVANRTHLDISSVSAAFYLEKSDTNEVKTLRIAYGGVAPTVIRLFDLENEYRGKVFNLDSAKSLGREIADTIKPLTDVRGSAEYRKKVSGNLPVRFYYDQQGGIQ